MFKCLSCLINNIFTDRHTVVKLTLKTQLAPRTVFRILRSEWSSSWEGSGTTQNSHREAEDIDPVLGSSFKQTYEAALQLWIGISEACAVHYIYSLQTSNRTHVLKCIYSGNYRKTCSLWRRLRIGVQIRSFPVNWLGQFSVQLHCLNCIRYILKLECHLVKREKKPTRCNN